ncbi:hypothetical protein B0T22DRAFT_483502 [Podospora appendiculata]|uniref:Uncharacterized protein n=1 Tax=Podospora appendiculata TaxID=314037 RepID=A0AAE0X3C9_9PEZI|nr:hypothetical protein B0T22DRAFT_483502 [Podospora appendiculata]
MSGSGGFYKYRCKHFLTHNCNNWVWVNGAACACCLAEGREAEDDIAAGLPSWLDMNQIQDVQAPEWPGANGMAYGYRLMQFVPTGQGNERILQPKVRQQQQQHHHQHHHQQRPIITVPMVTADMPRPVMSSTGIGNSMGY